MLWIPIAFDYLRKMSVWHHLVSWLNWRKPFVLGTKDRSSVIHIKKKTPPQKEGKKNPGKAYWWKGHLNTHLGSIFFYWLVSTQVHEIMRFCFQNTEPPYRRPQANSADLLDEHQLSAQCNFFGKKDKPLYVQGTFQILLFQLYSINPSYVTSCLPNCQEARCQ